MLLESGKLFLGKDADWVIRFHSLIFESWDNCFVEHNHCRHEGTVERLVGKLRHLFVCEFLADARLGWYRDPTLLCSLVALLVRHPVVNHHSCSEGLNLSTLSFFLRQLAHLDCGQIALNGVPKEHFTNLVGSQNRGRQPEKSSHYD